MSLLIMKGCGCHERWGIFELGERLVLGRECSMQWELNVRNNAGIMAASNLVGF